MGQNMTDPVINPGDKFHIITRRLFPEDVRRHMVGEVVTVSGALIEVRGYVFVYTPGTGEYRRHREARTRILSPADAGSIVTKLPPTVDIESVEYKVIAERLVATDNKTFHLDINEFGPAR